MIVVGGENLIDFIQEGGTPQAPLYRAAVGGSPLNTAKAAARQEVPVGYLTPISDDTLGRLIRADLAADGTALLAPASSRPTSLAVVSLESGQPAYQFYRERTAERDVTAAGLLAAIPPETEAIYVGSLAITGVADGAAWAEVYATLAERGIFTALDPNIRAAFIEDEALYRARLETLLGQTRLLKLSDEDIAWLYPGTPPREAAAAIHARSGADLVVLTMGSEGAVGYGAFGTVAVPAHPVPDLKDTVGAGDTFMGTLLAQTRRRGLASGGALASADSDTIASLLRTAGQAAAINCGRVGCNPPRLSELDTA